MKADLAYYRTVFKEIEQGELSRLYLFRGSESYIMEEMAGRIVSQTVSGDLASFNLTVAHGAEVDIDAFLTAAQAFPVMVDRRVLILKELEKLRGGWKKIIAYVSNPAPSSVVIFLFNTHDAAGRKNRPPREFTRFEKSIRASGKVIQFDSLSERELQRWIGRKAKRMGLEMDAGVRTALVRTVGTNLYEIQNELEKLSILYENRRVSADDLERVIGGYRLNAVYDLIEAVRPGDESKALKILARIFSTGAERPSVVLFHLIRHFISLLKIKAGYRTGGYRYDSLKKKANLYRMQEIMLWLENLRVTEIQMKSVSFPDELLVSSALLHSMRGKLVADSAGRPIGRMR